MDLDAKMKQISERIEQLKKEIETERKTGRYRESYEFILEAEESETTQSPAATPNENPNHIKCIITDTVTGKTAEGWGDTKHEARDDALSKLNFLLGKN